MNQKIINLMMAAKGQGVKEILYTGLNDREWWYD